LEKEIFKEMQMRMIRNFLDIIILAELRNRSALSGYDLIDFIHKKFGIMVSSGTVYAILYSMERGELIKGEWSRRRRIYLLTDKGRETFNAIWKSEENIQAFMRFLIGK